jgi:hypothetical protein
MGERLLGGGYGGRRGGKTWKGGRNNGRKEGRTKRWNNYGRDMKNGWGNKKTGGNFSYDYDGGFSSILQNSSLIRNQKNQFQEKKNYYVNNNQKNWNSNQYNLKNSHSFFNKLNVRPNVSKKIDKHISVPFIFPLDPYVSPSLLIHLQNKSSHTNTKVIEQKGFFIYSLYGMIVHLGGSVNSGHYFAFLGSFFFFFFFDFF